MLKHGTIEGQPKTSTTLQSDLSTHKGQESIIDNEQLHLSLMQKAQSAPETLSSLDILQLQQTLGNRATAQLLHIRGSINNEADHEQGTEHLKRIEAEQANESVITSQQFEADGEAHTLWAYEAAEGQTVVMVASDPMTVQQRLHKWKKEAAKLPDTKLKNNVLEWIDKCWIKLKELTDASKIENKQKRNHSIHDASANLKEMIKNLFWAFHIDLPELGAVAFYRGLHFSKDWQTKRGRTVEEENNRSFDSVSGEGSYSSAVWELATQFAQGKDITTQHLNIATNVIMNVLEQWKATSDYTREDSSRQGRDIVKKRAMLIAGISKFKQENNSDKQQQLEGLLESQKEGFTQSGRKFQNQFAAALSRYIGDQGMFEAEMAAGADGGYKDIPFKQIPFISTSKDAKEAVKYAQGKLASQDNLSTEGVVGRVLVYVAHRIDLLEAGGIDVWQELSEGKLHFTEWRMNENEITFSGKIPDHFLRDMTPVNAGEGIDLQTEANTAELAAAKAAVPLGGLKPLPTNKPLR